MNWPLDWTSLEPMVEDDFKCWEEASSTEVLTGGEEMCPVQRGENAPEASPGRKPDEQQVCEHPDTMRQVSRDDSCEAEMERPPEDQDMPLLWEDLFLQEGKGDNVRTKMRKSAGMGKPAIGTPTASSAVRSEAFAKGRTPSPVEMAHSDNPIIGSGWWNFEPADVPRTATGLKHRVVRLRALGNGQVPAVAALAWQILTTTD